MPQHKALSIYRKPEKVMVRLATEAGQKCELLLVTTLQPGITMTHHSSTMIIQHALQESPSCYVLRHVSCKFACLAQGIQGVVDKDNRMDASEVMLQCDIFAADAIRMNLQ